MNKLLTTLALLIGGIPALALVIALMLDVFVPITHGAYFQVEVVASCQPVEHVEQFYLSYYCDL